MLYISKLRDYIELEFQNQTHLSFKFELQRIIDDFIFLVFLLGNDFLPEQTGFDVFGGFFDRVIEIYQTTLSNDLEGYVTDKGVVNWRRAEILFGYLG
jgi:5'-3' exonuclease